jgi:DNA-binding transcriptional MocR family regulator
LWLPLSPQHNRSGFLAQLLLRGLAVVPDDAFAVGPLPQQAAVRVCLGAPRTREELTRALRALAGAFTAPSQSLQIV